MSGIQELSKVWMDGGLVPREQATLPVGSAAVFYATNVFEGLRAYWDDNKEELYCFRVAAHLARLRESMKMMRFTIPYSDEELVEAVREVLVGNDVHEDIHMHMVAYVGGSGQDATEPTGLYINPRRRGRMTAPDRGLSCCISSWTRTSDNAIPIRLKCGANYQNARLALLQAQADGYDGPIFLNNQGKVAEGTGASLFIVRKGKLITPTVTSDVLESITRSTLIEEIGPNFLGLDVGSVFFRLAPDCSELVRHQILHTTILYDGSLAGVFTNIEQHRRGQVRFRGENDLPIMIAQCENIPTPLVRSVHFGVIFSKNKLRFALHGR